MQCPRCGADNPPGVTACVRCGLPAYPTRSDPYTARPVPGPQGTGGSGDGNGSTLATTAAVLTLLASLTSLGYGVYALIARRGLFADISDDPASVSRDDAESSDTLNTVLVWVAVSLALIAFLMWVAAMIAARRGRNGLGVTGLALVVIGGAAAVVGALLLNGVDSTDEAGDGAGHYVIIGIGFVVMGIGLLLGALALRRRATAATSPAAPGYGPGPYAAPGYGPPGGPTPYGDSPYGKPMTPNGGQPEPGPYGPPPGSGPPDNR